MTPLINKYQIYKLNIKKSSLTNSIDTDILAAVKAKTPEEHNKFVHSAQVKIKELNLF